MIDEGLLEILWKHLEALEAKLRKVIVAPTIPQYDLD